MRTTIDKAGRVVIPKALRDALGLVPGPVELLRDGAGLRIEPVVGEGFTERDGRLIIDDPLHLDDASVRDLRLDDQR
jgi:AbrB family looped-hinge helix DNA binding protein